MTLHDEVKKWLREQGYPLEIKVATLFRQFGFSVVQSTYLQDLVSGKSREIDVLANKRIATLTGNVDFTVVVECKAPQKGRPWLLFRSDSVPFMPKMFWLNQYPIAYVDGQQLADILNIRTLSELDTFSQKSKWSYGVTEALTSGNDRAYAATCSVANASRALVEKAKLAMSRGHRIFEVIIPVVVIDTPILEVFIDDQEEIQVSDTFGGSFSYRDMQAMHIHIRTFNSLEPLVQQLSNDADQFLKEVYAQLKPTWDEHSKTLKHKSR